MFGLTLLLGFNLFWCESYAEGYKTAKDSQLGMVVVCEMENCLACKKLESQLASIDPGDRVAVKTKDSKVARDLGVTAFPTIVICDKNMVITARLVGYQSAADIQKALK
jgi:thioredoxin-related protein